MTLLPDSAIKQLNFKKLILRKRSALRAPPSLVCTDIAISLYLDLYHLLLFFNKNP